MENYIEELMIHFDETFLTVTLPIVLVMVIVVRNHIRMKENIKKINNRCGQGCKGCQRRPLCRKPNKE